jgi:hypothetical protein
MFTKNVVSQFAGYFDNGAKLNDVEQYIHEFNQTVCDTLLIPLAGLFGEVKAATEFCKLNADNLITKIGEKLGLLADDAILIEELSQHSQAKDIIKLMK